MDEVIYLKATGRKDGEKLTIIRDLFTKEIKGFAADWPVTPSVVIFCENGALIATIALGIELGHFEEVQWPPRNGNPLANPLGFER